MKRPSIALIDDNINDLLLLTRALSKTRFNPIVFTYTRPDEFIKDFHTGKINPGLVMCDHNLKPEKSTDVVRKLRMSNYRGTFFVVSGERDFLSQTHLKTTDDLKLDVTDIWGKEDLCDQIKIDQILEDVVRKEFLVTPYRIAIAGVGDLGTEIAAQCLEKRIREIPYISEVLFWGSRRESLSNARRLIGEFNWTRVIECGSLEELAYSRADAFVIARGPRDFDPATIKNRADADHLMMSGSWQKVDECYRYLYEAKYKGLIIPVSNRVGPHCLRGLDWNPEWARKIVSPSADGDRLVAMLFRKLKESDQTRQFLLTDVRQVRIGAYGEHGEEEAYLEGAYVEIGAHEVPLKEVNPLYESADYRRAIEKQIAKETHPIGKETQLARKLTGSSPKDAANAVARFFDALARNRDPYSAVQSYVPPYAIGPEQEFFLLQPLALDFKNECLVPDSRVFRAIDQLPPELKTQLGMQGIKQYGLAGYFPRLDKDKRYLPKK